VRVEQAKVFDDRRADGLGRDGAVAADEAEDVGIEGDFLLVALMATPP